MSKAFTKESDDAPEEFTPRPRAPLPPGVKNYLTAAGAQRLRDEREQLQSLRSSLVSAKDASASGVDDAETKRRLREVDGRIRGIEEILESAEVVESPRQHLDRVQFGAQVTVRNDRGEELAWRIVGVDEADVEQGRVSWLSPVSKALLNARVGDVVRFRSPDGEVKFKVLRVDYTREV